MLLGFLAVAVSLPGITGDSGSTARAAQPPAASADGPRIALSASLFATAPGGAVNSVALLWSSADPADVFEVHRAAGKNTTFTKIYSGLGVSFNDYGLKNGTYSYKLVARRGAETLTSSIARVTTMPMPAGVSEYSNQTGTGAALGEPLKVGGTHYRFDGKRDGKTVSYSVKTSTDGKTWKDGPVVLDQKSHPDLADFKLEAENRFYDKAHNKIVWWAHWERAAGYASGRAMVATATPGEPFTVHHIYNPLGLEVRDMSVFRDDDGQGYLIAAANRPGQGANATLHLLKLNADYTDVTGITNKVMENGYREAPHIVKSGGFYYLFFSQAAGWYPSRAGYVSGRSLDGKWSEVRYVGNTSTFSAQSGGILDYGNGAPLVPVLMANRWIRGEGTSRNAVVPLHLVDGFALGDYAPTLLLDPEKDRVIPLHRGRLLSQGQPATASIPGTSGHEASQAFDGDYATSFQSDEKQWPFTVTTDLGTACTVRNVQISWHLHKGSEAYYKYTIEGSLDGKEWRVLRDRTDDKDTTVSKTYGFSSDLLPDAPVARWVRINVNQAVLHNNPNNWYPPTLYEVKVYGEKGTERRVKQ
ncbi:MAG: discoidin domain-containing protein [Armatimonadota bacterium]